MKIKVGNKLMSIREERKLNQNEMAELLGISPSSYGRIERNESSPDLDQLVQFSKTLNVPIQDFLPDTFSIHNNHNGGQAGIIFGTFNYYTDKNAEVVKMESENRLLQLEITHLKEKISWLEERLGNKLIE
jgi:transcriptional regulator with XRE-family HTH domain